VRPSFVVVFRHDRTGARISSVEHGSRWNAPLVEPRDGRGGPTVRFEDSWLRIIDRPEVPEA
jgi:hypothetical protein